MKERVHLRSLNKEELTSWLTGLKQPAFRAGQVLDWLWKKQVVTPAEMKNLPSDLKKVLTEHSQASVLELVRVPESKNHESFKYLMKTQDDHLIESVLIAQQDRRTVCVSTQIGCKIGCSFCASGKGKFGRNLTAGEIVEQVSLIARHQGQSITNIVFMGMGEPLDNYEATMKAIEILTAEWGFALGGRRITVSTSGITPKIEAFVRDVRGRVRLSVSLHSSDQATRSELVPINKKWKLDELIATLERLNRELKREITFEYTLIADVNDSEKEAKGVARIASRLGAKVNIIPYNPIREMDYKTPSQERIAMFQSLLESKHVKVIVRQTAGRDIDAACGQLRQDRMN